MTPSQLIEFLLLLLIASSAIAFAAHRLRIPYTVALVLGGFGINFFHVPIRGLTGGIADGHVLSPDIVFILFLPALLFEAGINLNLRHLRSSLLPILVLSIAGVLVAVVITGFGMHQFAGIPLMPALLFGALISATDPVAVLALFRTLGVDKRMSILIEGESLFNDGTAIVVFQILAAAAVPGGEIRIADGIRQFAIVAGGGAVLGLVCGFAASRITRQIDDARVEITLSMIVAYGTYLVGEHLHVSGVIATVLAGVTIGTYGARVGMSARTRLALWAYWEYISFAINSLLFLLIGIEVQFSDFVAAWEFIVIAIAVVVAGRAAAVYGLIPLSNLRAPRIPFNWQTLAVWGGLHGGVSIALALSLRPGVPARGLILTMTFGVVAFSIVVQGLTLKPALRFLGIHAASEDEHDRLRAHAIAVKAALRELVRLRRDSIVSPASGARLRDELRSRLRELRKSIAVIEERNPEAQQNDLRVARIRLLRAERSALRHAVNEGLIPEQAEAEMTRDLDLRLDELSR